MQYRRRGKPKPSPVEYFPEFTIGRRTLRPGDQCRRKGKQGLWTFSAYVKNTETGAEWLDVYSPASMYGPGQKHAVPLEDVTPIPRKRKRNG